MMYAMISEKDGQTSLAYFKGKKIPQSHYVPVSRLQHLVKVLNDGDVVHVINADRFPSAGVWSLFLGTAGGCAPATANAALCWLFMTSVCNYCYCRAKSNYWAKYGFNAAFVIVRY